MVKCPGQEQRFWKPDDIFEVRCSSCDSTIEFFKDEPQLKCRKCSHVAVNPKIDLGCAQWCQYAERCLGVTKTHNINSLRVKLIDDMKKLFGNDQKRINHALTVLNYAEHIQKAEGGDPLVVKVSAILHDIGIHEAERKYGSSAGKYQEIEGPPIAGRILEKCDIDKAGIEHICKIIANHYSARDIDTIEFRILWDADWLVNLPTVYTKAEWVKLRQIIGKTFKTNKGYQMALELFAEGEYKNI